MKTLTRSQREVYDYVCGYIKQSGYSPTFREIQSHFKFSSLASVYTYVKVLKKKGFFRNETHASISLSSSMEMLHKEELEIKLPYIGCIAQGFPIETFPQSKTISVPLSLVHEPENTYVLRAKGETLSEERIADGDLLLVEARQEAQYGEIVIATIKQHDTMVKRYYPEGFYVRLEGSYDQHQPIILEKDQVVIQGILIGLMRLYI